MRFPSGGFVRFLSDSSDDSQSRERCALKWTLKQLVKIPEFISHRAPAPRDLTVRDRHRHSRRFTEITRRAEAAAAAGRKEIRFHLLGVCVTTFVNPSFEIAADDLCERHHAILRLTLCS